MMKKMKKMQEIDLNDQRILIREDFNVPLDGDRITDDERIRRALPTIKSAMQQGARILICSHLGRPKEGGFDAKFSLKPVAARLSQLLDTKVALDSDWLGGVDIARGQVVLAENVRFNKGELENDLRLSERMAALCDIFVMDAFATAHRKQASTYGVAELVPIACAGPLLLEEVDALDRVVKDPQRPLCAIVGGAKVSSKIAILESMLDKVDQLIVGGGIANTFLAAKGYAIGCSLYEEDWLDSVKYLFEKAEQTGVAIPLPIDVVVAKDFSSSAEAILKNIDDIEQDDMILDMGPETSQLYSPIISQAATILWNGPLGVFEFENFSLGTRRLAENIVASSAYSIAGGGDTLAALELFHAKAGISYISTGGGAFLEYVEKGSLPVIDILEKRSNNAN